MVRQAKVVITKVGARWQWHLCARDGLPVAQGVQDFATEAEALANLNKAALAMADAKNVYLEAA